MTLPDTKNQNAPVITEKVKISLVLQVNKITIDPASDSAWTGRTLLQPISFKSGRHLS